ncbi:MAG: MGMT family protein [Desulfuromonadales bacterium]|nr:MGMT family protein [Desulfuromonadales bacterium]
MVGLYWQELPVTDGILGVVADDVRLQRIYYLASRRALRETLAREFPTAVFGNSDLLTEAVRQFDDVLHGRRRFFSLPLASQQLSPFARAVGQALQQIPPGQTVSYAALAQRAGFPKAARAVGRVMARNPFPIVIPCHRVICSDGRPGQYSAARGTASKLRLLAAERRMFAGPQSPTAGES